jgi:hypothetical protein
VLVSSKATLEITGPDMETTARAVALALAFGVVEAFTPPFWSTTVPDSAKPLGGIDLLPAADRTHVEIYHGDEASVSVPLGCCRTADHPYRCLPQHLLAFPQRSAKSFN